MRTLALLTATLFACGSDSLPPVDPPDDAGPTPDAPTPFTECDADPPAFVRNAFLAITGRRPLGQAEVDVYLDLYNKAAAAGLDPKVAVATAITDAPEYGARWEGVLMDAVRVQRIDVQSMASCWGNAGASTVTPDLARAIRDNDAVTPRPQTGLTMLDVARSALALDDLTAVYRAQLFHMVSIPPGTANVGPVEAELAQRADLGATFDAAWLRRDMVCLGCHNSQTSVTDSDDPALDRHWPVPGQPEQAIYGASSGIDAARAHGVWRVSGFIFAGSNTPWGLSSQCGTFAAPSAVGPDIAGIDTKLASATGRRTTVYDLDIALRRGFERLRGQGPTIVGGAIVDPDEALAWLVTLSMTEEIWREIVGSQLTIANSFPRNEAASLLLTELATEFAKSGFSLKTLIAKIVSTEYFSRKAAEEGCGLAYGYPRVFDPWTTSDPDPARRGNGPGDAIVWLPPRTLALAVAGALDWTLFPLLDPFPFAFFGGDEAGFQRSIGVFLRNSERGFRGLNFQARLAWENRFGTCSKPIDPNTGTPIATDFIDRVRQQASAQPASTVADVVLALKDRMIGEPVIAPDETALLEALVGPLTAPATGLSEANARHYCGVLLGTPQFTFSGMPGKGGPVPVLTPVEARTDAVCARLDNTPLGDGRIARCSAGSVSIQ